MPQEIERAVIVWKSSYESPYLLCQCHSIPCDLCHVTETTRLYCHNKDYHVISFNTPSDIEEFQAIKALYPMSYLFTCTTQNKCR